MEDRERTKVFLLALLDSMSGFNRPLKFFHKPSYENAWPEPRKGSHAFQVLLNDDGSFPLSEFEPPTACTDSAFSLPSPYQGKITLANALEMSTQHAVNQSSIHSLGQLCDQVGRALDSMILEALHADDNGERLIPIGDGDNLSVTLRASEDDSKHVAEMKLANYNDAASTHFCDRTHMSLSLDKSRVFGHGICNAAIAFPDNHAFWAPTQVVPDYRGHAAELHESGLHTEAEEAIAASNKRSSAWLSGEEVAKGLHRQNKRYRVTSKETLY